MTNFIIDNRNLILSNKELFIIRLIPLNLNKTEMLVILGFTMEDWLVAEKSVFFKFSVTNWNEVLLKSFELKILNKIQFIDPLAKTLSHKYAKILCSYSQHQREVLIENTIKGYFKETYSIDEISREANDFFKSVSVKNNHFQIFNAFRRKAREKQVNYRKSIDEQLIYVRRAVHLINKLLIKNNSSDNLTLDLVALFLRVSFNDWDFNHIPNFTKEFKFFYYQAEKDLSNRTVLIDKRLLHKPNGYYIAS